MLPRKGTAEHDALVTLRELGIPARTVIRTYPDSVLFLSPEGIARTAWITRRPNGDLRVVVEDGFAAFPSRAA